MSDKPENVYRHMDICNELNLLYERKNRDYGDSFHKTFLEEGFAMARIRLADKFERFKTLSRKDDSERVVEDETLRDTLIDMANYAIMTVMEMDIQTDERKTEEPKKAEIVSQEKVYDFMEMQWYDLTRYSDGTSTKTKCDPPELDPPWNPVTGPHIWECIKDEEGNNHVIYPRPLKGENDGD